MSLQRERFPLPLRRCARSPSDARSVLRTEPRTRSARLPDTHFAVWTAVFLPDLLYLTCMMRRAFLTVLVGGVACSGLRARLADDHLPESRSRRRGMYGCIPVSQSLSSCPCRGSVFRCPYADVHARLQTQGLSCARNLVHEALAFRTRILLLHARLQTQGLSCARNLVHEALGLALS